MTKGFLIFTCGSGKLAAIGGPSVLTSGVLVCSLNAFLLRNPDAVAGLFERAEAGRVEPGRADAGRPTLFFFGLFSGSSSASESKFVFQTITCSSLSEFKTARQTCKSNLSARSKTSSVLSKRYWIYWSIVSMKSINHAAFHNIQNFECPVSWACENPTSTWMKC